jgi:hypothetical protein
MMEWTADDIVLSVEADVESARHPLHADAVVRRLAEETERSVEAAEAGMRAVARADGIGRGLD